MIIQKETGGNLVEILEKIAETIRGRYRFYGKLRALTAEGRVSGVVLGVLPIVHRPGASRVMNPTYMAGLVTTPIGRSFLIYAVVSWLVGHRLAAPDGQGGAVMDAAWPWLAGLSWELAAWSPLRPWRRWWLLAAGVRRAVRPASATR